MKNTAWNWKIRTANYNMKRVNDVLETVGYKLDDGDETGVNWKEYDNAVEALDTLIKFLEKLKMDE